MTNRLVPILAGVGVILLAGALHGYWTLRWFATPAIAAAQERLADVPADFGEWKATPLDVPQEELVRAGALGWKLLSYSDAENEVPTNMLLLLGRPGAMTIHRPENCYPGAGYALQGRPVRYTVRDGQGEPLGEFWTARFERPTATGPVTLRIFWGWNAQGKWVAPDNPRWSLASEPVLYKLYLIREITQRVDKLDQEPLVAFLRELLPRLNRALNP